MSATSTARIWLAASIVVVFSGWGVARGADAPSGLGDGIALSVRLVRPDEQGERLIGLCRGSRAANPAAALAAWKQATGGRGTLGKPLEAAVAMLNPAMIREFRGLNGAEFLLGRDPDTGRLRWRAAVPRDDGSFAALATALALTDGGVEAPLGASQVFRVGPPGSALASVREGRLALGSSREELRLVVDRLGAPQAAPTGLSGVVVRLAPGGLRGLTSILGRRLSAGLDAIGCTDAEGWLALDDQTITLDLTARVAAAPARSVALEAGWLDVVPASGVLAAASVALDTTSAGALDAAFAVLDRVERADPARAGVAPIRVRLNVLAAAARVRPESDLWPNLNGVTAALLVNADGQADGAVVALHAIDDAAAGRIAREVLPKLTASFRKNQKPVDKPRAPLDGNQYMGAIEGRSLEVTTQGRMVLVGWGDGSIAKTLAALEHREQSAGPALRAGWSASPPQRAGGVWVARIGAIAALGAPLAQALEGAPPIVWQGRTEGATARDLVRWTNLRGVVKRWLDALPLQTPPDR